jgi:hypothetical protein
MSNQIIVYEKDDGGVAVVTPTPEALDKLGINAIALKDVPAGKPFKIVDASEIPQDSMFFDAWEVVINEPDGSGADYGVGSTNEVVGWDENRNPIIRGATE